MNKPKDDSKPEPLPKATVARRRFSWLIWLIPLAAAGFVGWLVYKDVFAKGPTITIYFQEAGGIDPGNTQVKCRGAPVGTVKHMTLSNDHQWVAVIATLEHEAESLAREGSQFWVVRPQLGIGGVRGLQTIMSGSYIEVRPGSGQPTNTFVGLEGPPVVQVAGPALSIVLLAPNLGSLQQQSPIYFRGIQVGEVTHYQLGKDAQEVYIRAHIRGEYAPLVRRNSVFWNAGGIDVNFSLLHGASISAESAKALLAGAIEFSTPEDVQEPAPDGMTFRLFEKPLPEWKNWRPSIPLTQLPPSAIEPPRKPPSKFRP